MYIGRKVDGALNLVERDYSFDGMIKLLPEQDIGANRVWFDPFLHVVAGL